MTINPARLLKRNHYNRVNKMLRKSRAIGYKKPVFIEQTPSDIPYILAIFLGALLFESFGLALLLKAVGLETILAWLGA